jgi:hypothetical protein
MLVRMVGELEDIGERSDQRQVLGQRRENGSGLVGLWFGGLAGGRRGALRLGDRLRGRLADFVDDARHLGDAGADRGSQAAPPRNQLIARAGAAHEERLQDAVCGDRLTERRQRGSRRKVAGVDMPCGDLPDDWSGR